MIKSNINNSRFITFNDTFQQTASSLVQGRFLTSAEKMKKIISSTIKLFYKRLYMESVNLDERDMSERDVSRFFLAATNQLYTATILS
ncbi:hypothetical protein PBAL39_03060 [Pedobacter sp. BAL39]|nr:hypothetical protein PBAL39_03060 [Pedobacter sp. BAL39]